MKFLLGIREDFESKSSEKNKKKHKKAGLVKHHSPALKLKKSILKTSVSVKHCINSKYYHHPGESDNHAYN